MNSTNPNFNTPQKINNNQPNNSDTLTTPKKDKNHNTFVTPTKNNYNQTTTETNYFTQKPVETLNPSRINTKQLPEILTIIGELQNGNNNYMLYGSIAKYVQAQNNTTNNTQTFGDADILVDGKATTTYQKIEKKLNSLGYTYERKDDKFCIKLKNDEKCFELNVITFDLGWSVFPDEVINKQTKHVLSWDVDINKYNDYIQTVSYNDISIKCISQEIINKMNKQRIHGGY